MCGIAGLLYGNLTGFAAPAYLAWTRSGELIVMGVLGDFTGHPAEALEDVKKRKFVEITPDNFDDVLAKMKPHLAFSVDNKLSEGPDAPKLKVDLHFKSLDDFSPEEVARQVPLLRELLEKRQKLANLRGSMQTDESIDKALQDLIGNTEKMNQLRSEASRGGDK